MPLTVSEKQHWRDRIAKRIDKKITGITNRNPGLFQRVTAAARTRAIATLGLTDLLAEQDRIDHDKKVLEARDSQVSRELLAQVRGVDVSTIDTYGRYSSDPEVTKAIKSRQAVHEDELLAEHDLGQEVIKLRLEKEHLLDTVFLATSPIQIRTLWQQVSDLLGDELSQLQKSALQIEPPIE